MIEEKDYSGFATAEIVAVYQEFIEETRLDWETFSLRVPINERDLKKSLVTQDYPFTGLGKTDKILHHGMDKSVSQLSMDGVLHCVPARNSRNAARRMVDDRIWVIRYDEGLDEDVVIFSPDEIEAQIDELLEMRRIYVVPTEAQKERLKKDVARTIKRRN